VEGRQAINGSRQAMRAVAAIVKRDDRCAEHENRREGSERMPSSMQQKRLTRGSPLEWIAAAVLHAQRLAQ
jgi:hypothetical protein